jgi:hypothetical protein
VNPFGGHLLKQGINPFANTNTVGQGNSLSTGFGGALPLSNPIYLDTIANNERQNPELGPTSRLNQFLTTKIQSDSVVNDQVNLYSYSGGPGSTLGVGNTNILLSKERTGLNNPQLKNSGFFTTGISPDTNFGFDYSVFTKRGYNFRGGTYFGSYSSTKSVSGKYSAASPNTNRFQLLQDHFKTINETISADFISKVGQSVFQPNSFDSNKDSVSGLKDTLDYTQLMDAGSLGIIDNEIIEDFRKKK